MQARRCVERVRKKEFAHVKSGDRTAESGTCSKKEIHVVNDRLSEAKECKKIGGRRKIHGRTHMQARKRVERARKK